MTKPGKLTLSDDFFAGPTLDVARDLIGCTLIRDAAGGRMVAQILETEAYTDDAASHFVTRPRKAAMMGSTHGLIYVYRIYGVHRCLNVTTDARGPGAVLFLALLPLEGIDAMAARRGVSRDDASAISGGPARLFVALGLDDSLLGRVATEEFTFERPRRRPDVVAGPRVGISRATELPWRFRLARIVYEGAGPRAGSGLATAARTRPRPPGSPLRAPSS